MNNFLIITNALKDPEFYISKKLTAYLRSKGKKCECIIGKSVRFEPSRSSAPAFVEADGEITTYRYINPREIPRDTEGMIVLGGDGTLLQVARDTARLQIPIVGINLGTLGYLAEISKANMLDALDALIDDHYTIERRMMLKGTLYREDKELFTDVALNDILIQRIYDRSMIQVNNYIDKSHLNSYFTDAMIISSPTGSTGYALSAGGPIVAPQASLFMLTPLAPHSMINRSVIVPSENVVSVELGKDKYGYENRASLVFDGNHMGFMISGDRLVVTKSPVDVKMMKIYESSFMDVLSRKMR